MCIICKNCYQQVTHVIDSLLNKYGGDTALILYRYMGVALVRICAKTSLTALSTSHVMPHMCQNNYACHISDICHIFHRHTKWIYVHICAATYKVTDISHVTRNMAHHLYTLCSSYLHILQQLWLPHWKNSSHCPHSVLAYRSNISEYLTKHNQINPSTSLVTSICVP